jgi:prepilin-type N-terminal cleavage/methylation domain-containing protein
MKKLSSFSSRRSFTLVEMLTAMAVLALLLALIFGVMTAATKLADSSERTGDSDIEARQVLDRIGVDIAGMVFRPTADQLFSKNDIATVGTANDTMYFYSQQVGYGVGTNASPVSLVGYRIAPANPALPISPSNQPVLQRLARGLDWDNSTNSMQFLAPSRSPTNANDYPAPLASTTIPVQWATVVGSGPPYDSTMGGASLYYDAIGSQVFRFEICFQQQNGTFSLDPGSLTNSAPVASGSNTNTVAIVVAIAVMDSKSRQIVPDASWNKLQTALRDPLLTDLQKTPPTPPDLMDSIWNKALTAPDFAANAGIPEAAASHIKVYQRYYYLNTPKAQ